MQSLRRLATSRPVARCAVARARLGAPCGVVARDCSSAPRGSSFWAWTLQSRPSWRESPSEAVVAIAVFGVTGTTSVALVRPALKQTFGLEGSMIDGPWSYRVTSLLVVSPIYASLLVTFGTLAGRHRYFASMATKIFGRFVPRAVIRRISDVVGWCTGMPTTRSP